MSEFNPSRLEEPLYHQQRIGEMQEIEKKLSTVKKALEASYKREGQLTQAQLEAALKIYTPEKILQLIKDYQVTRAEKLKEELAYVKRVLKGALELGKVQYQQLLKQQKETPEKMLQLVTQMKLYEELRMKLDKLI